MRHNLVNMQTSSNKKSLSLKNHNSVRCFADKIEHFENALEAAMAKAGVSRGELSFERQGYSIFFYSHDNDIAARAANFACLWAKRYLRASISDSMLYPATGAVDGTTGTTHWFRGKECKDRLAAMPTTAFIKEGYEVSSDLVWK